MAGIACIFAAIWLYFFSGLGEECCVFVVCIILGVVGIGLLGEKD
jgi:hypothetical protein